MSRSYTSSPPSASVACCRTALAFSKVYKSGNLMVRGFVKVSVFYYVMLAFIANLM
jgi:hypothetical protein